MNFFESHFRIAADNLDRIMQSLCDSSDCITVVGNLSHIGEVLRGESNVIDVEYEEISSTPGQFSDIPVLEAVPVTRSKSIPLEAYVWH